MEFAAYRVQWPSFVVAMLNPRDLLPEGHLHFKFYLLIYVFLIKVKFSVLSDSITLYFTSIFVQIKRKRF